MTVVVTFLKPLSLGGGWGGAGIGSIRAQERLAAGGTTAGTVQFGDIVLIGNGEAAMIAVAYGTVPNADATAEALPTTSASFPVGAGQVSVPMTNLPIGSKINVKTVT